MSFFVGDNDSGSKRFASSKVLQTSLSFYSAFYFELDIMDDRALWLANTERCNNIEDLFRSLKTRELGSLLTIVYKKIMVCVNLAVITLFITFVLKLIWACNGNDLLSKNKVIFVWIFSVQFMNLYYTKREKL